VIRYEASDRRETPDIMTRYREEVYDTKAHRAWVKVQGSSDARDPYAEAARSAAERKERRALRSQYFTKKPKGRKTTTKNYAQRRLEDA